MNDVTSMLHGKALPCEGKFQFPTKGFFTVLLALLAGLAPLHADNPPKKIALSDFPAAAVQEVVVPVPSEIFAVLDKLGNPNWKAQLREGKVRTPEDRVRTALLLGNVIAEGFVAVEAEDAERVKELGRQVLTLAEAINVATLAKTPGLLTSSKRIVNLLLKEEFVLSIMTALPSS